MNEQDKASGRIPAARASTARSPTAKPRPGRAAGLLRGLGLLAVLAGLGCLGLLMFEQQRALEVLHHRQIELDQAGQSAASALSALQLRIEALQSQAGESRELLAQAEERLRQQRVEFGVSLERVQEDLENTRIGLNTTVSGVDPQWLLTEAEALVRLARQRLLAARDVESAIALLVASDDILKRINDAAAFALREALAVDLADLRELPRLDVQDLYQDLEAVEQRLQGLSIITSAAELRPPDLPASRPQETVEEDYLDQILKRLEDYIKVRELDQPVPPMLSSEERYYKQHNILLALEQARLALLREQPDIYRSNLARAITEIEAFVVEDGEQKQQVLARLSRLHDARIQLPRGTVDNSLAAFRKVLAARRESGGSEGAGSQQSVNPARDNPEPEPRETEDREAENQEAENQESATEGGESPAAPASAEVVQPAGGSSPSADEDRAGAGGGRGGQT